MRKLLHLLLLASTFSGLVTNIATAEELKKLRALSVDFDDTFMHTKSKIYIYDKNSNVEVGVSTQEFAEVKTLLKQPGPYENFELRAQDETKSFREFRDLPGTNVMLETVRETIDNGNPKDWQGPVWDTIVEALNDPEQAKWFSVITARGHSPNELHEAIEFLSSRGYFNYVPRKEFVFTVGSSSLQQAMAKKMEASGVAPEKPLTTEELKVMSMELVLDRLQKEVVRRQAKGEKLRGEFIFVDDDFANFEKAEKGLYELSQRWPDVDLFVSYVGTKHPDRAPYSMNIEKKSPESLKCKQLVFL